MEKENAIIIDGVKHTLVKITSPEICGGCSLQKLCDIYTNDLWNADGICIGIFSKKKHHFKILKQE